MLFPELSDVRRRTETSKDKKLFLVKVKERVVRQGRAEAVAKWACATGTGLKGRKIDPWKYFTFPVGLQRSKK